MEMISSSSILHKTQSDAILMKNKIDTRTLGLVHVWKHKHNDLTTASRQSLTLTPQCFELIYVVIQIEKPMYISLDNGRFFQYTYTLQIKQAIDVFFTTRKIINIKSKMYCQPE